MNSNEYDEFLVWLESGQHRGWVGKVHCAVHDGPELSEEEIAIVDREEGELDAICVPTVRVWLE